MGKSSPTANIDGVSVSIDRIFGHAVMSSWLRIDGDRLVGMGRVDHYDRNGILVESITEPTGIVLF